MILEIEELHQKDVMAVSKLIERSFTTSVASTLTNEGVSTFMSGLTSESIEKRRASGNTFIVCRNEKSIVGVAEIRDKNHLNLLFVEPSIQRKGIGRKLLLNLVDRVRESQITVNSSLNSVDAYSKFGFQKIGPKSEVKGIRYQPMVYEIEL
ncbi:MAG: GNAT family N-acetyltransferase [Pseudomonadales bacterium]|nr:GNAT family N-acetyltransferase [Pseudomonadales bacterium]